MRNRTAGRQQSPADRYFLHHCRQSRIYHGALCRPRSYLRSVYRQKGTSCHLALRAGFRSRTIPAVHACRRRLRTYQQGRSADNAVCSLFHRAYPCHRLFFTESGRCQTLMHAVLCGRNPVHNTDVPSRPCSGIRPAVLQHADRFMASCPLCRCTVLRCGVYTADRCPGRYRSYGCLHDTLP